MNQVTTTELRRIVSISLYHVDIENKSNTSILISNENKGLENYLNDLLDEIKHKTQKRSYEFIRETTEFYTTLTSYFVNQNLDINKHSKILADRLLDKELETELRYGHLAPAGTGHVKKGSFLQFIYRDGGVISYLGVKIEHQSFIDETDFIKKIGLSIVNKVYKACWVTFTENGLPTNVYVYDTNSKPSVYWWKDFLELKQTRDDKYNTRTAIESVVRTLDTIKHKYPADYTILRNASIAAFKQQVEMKFDQFITNTFTNYVPENPELAEKKLGELVVKMNDLPNNKNFDSMFTLEPKEVPYRKKQISLSKEISLQIVEGIKDIDEKIWAEETSDGEKLIVIKSSDAFKNFKLKVRAV